MIKLIAAIQMDVASKKDNKGTQHMKRSVLLSSVAACLCLGLAVPLLAAEPSATGAANQPSPGAKSAAATQPAEKCLSDLRAFNSQMEKDGYWLGGSGYSYGYPLGEPGYGYRMGDSPASTAGYHNARPGYEVRILVASATILARNGQQQPCEDVLATTRDTYQRYVTEMHSGKVHTVDVPGWRKQQIAAAQPVTSQNTSFRSDQLLGTDVRDTHNEALGSVDDIVMSPQTGKIAYLVVSRGGIFGIGEKYVPVPWQSFKVTPNANLLVLDATKTAMDGAPQVKNDQFGPGGNFVQESQKVDAYWKTHLSDNGANLPTKGTTGSKN
ncbi:PRC-barrel domain-containing protein [Rhodoplanes sp. Z2-YC6860]|uniref:PRC-barrel domain-containing protein n=1 Tax=Rhodoplanes sp. Z2-YC6860 TaxID=674703 RepID=UPI00078D2FAA|nr:PRC-barrel domain-containing protein [Rhodoplanes sp. Z2-YC6860]AMN39726.1 PRC-barrel domain protein [Rhodoplanes sp. Z2-YC6860]